MVRHHGGVAEKRAGGKQEKSGLKEFHLSVREEEHCAKITITCQHTLFLARESHMRMLFNPFLCWASAEQHLHLLFSVRHESPVLGPHTQKPTLNPENKHDANISELKKTHPFPSIPHSSLVSLL